MKINITGALKKGRITKEELAAKLWPKSNDSVRYQSILRLGNEKLMGMSFEQIAIMYECYGVKCELFNTEKTYSEQEVNGAYAKGFEDGNQRDRE